MATQVTLLHMVLLMSSLAKADLSILEDEPAHSFITNNASSTLALTSMFDTVWTWPSYALEKLCSIGVEEENDPRAPFEALRLSQLQQKALEFGATKDEVDFALDSNDPRAAMLDLVAPIDAFDSLGFYEIVHDGTLVTSHAEAFYGTFVTSLAEAPPESLTTLSNASLVNVLEIREVSDRIRGRIESPQGWISLLQPSNGYRWAKKVQRDAYPCSKLRSKIATKWERFKFENREVLARIGEHIERVKDGWNAYASEAYELSRRVLADLAAQFNSTSAFDSEANACHTESS